MVKPMSKTAVTLNLVPVEVDSKSVLKIGYQPYKDSQQLEDLRAEYRGTHFFRRYSSNKGSDSKYNDVITCVALLPGFEPIGENFAERTPSQVPWLVAPLALEAWLRYFHEQGRPVLAHKPLQILSNNVTDQLLSKSAKGKAEIPDWMEKKLCYIFDTRILYPASGEPMIVIAIDIRARNLISASGDKLIAAGVPLISRYVQIRQPGGDSRLTPKTKLVGRVEGVNGDTLTLRDCENGYEQVSTTDVYLEPRQENISWCLQHLCPDHAESILTSLDAESARLRQGQEKLRRIRSLFDHLRGQQLYLMPNVGFSIGALIQQNSQNGWFPSCEVIKKPFLVFDPSGTRTDIWNERGLDSNGPYDQRFFTPKQPRIAIICQAELQGQVEQFLNKFLEGLPSVNVTSGNSTRAPYAKGFYRRYFLEKVHLKIYSAKDARAESYLAECRRAIADATQSGQEWDLAIVQIEESFHQLVGNANPYLATKSFFMKRQVPVQEVTIEKMCSSNNDLVFILNDISIATYAKLNGVPWLLRSGAAIAHELVIGLGSYHLSGSRLGPKERVVGITTVFTGDGNYLLDNNTAAVPFEEYSGELLSSLQAMVQEIRKEQNWRPSDAIRLIFHTFKAFKDTEVEAVDKVMAQLGLPNVKYAFVHLVDDHPFHIFDQMNQGAYFSRDVKKGIYAPERGLLLKLTRDEALLAFKGSREVKQPQDGIPQPVLLRLHRNSTFKDMTYIARQAFNFSCHSWRAFSPSPLPITIIYSELIAKLLRNLQDMSDWDNDAMLGKIGRTRWFL